jgi:hypothetical protein
VLLGMMCVVNLAELATACVDGNAIIYDDLSRASRIAGEGERVVSLVPR